MKTAVEWLVDYLKSNCDYNIEGTIFFEQAKEMEKEQMGYPKEKVDKLIDSLYNNNMCSTIGDELIETFKSE